MNFWQQWDVLAWKPFEIDNLPVIQTVEAEIATTKLPVISNQ